MDQLIEPYLKFIRHLGTVPQSELNFNYSKMDVFVLPLWLRVCRELQQQWHAVVPIVSENCGYTDIIQNNINGFVVPIRSSYLIEEKIKYLSDNPAILKSIRERSLQTAISLSWDKYHASIQDFYHSISDV